MRGYTPVWVEHATGLELLPRSQAWELSQVRTAVRTRLVWLPRAVQATAPYIILQSAIVVKQGLLSFPTSHAILDPAMNESEIANREAVLAYLEGARDALQGAQYNLGGGFCGIAVNRAY